jgi:hypothetical protein
MASTGFGFSDMHRRDLRSTVPERETAVLGPGITSCLPTTRQLTACRLSSRAPNLADANCFQPNPNTIPAPNLKLFCRLLSPSGIFVVEEFTAASSSELVAQDYAAETAVDRHFSAVVLDKAKLPELIHEKIDPGPGCADHLCQDFLTDPGNYSFGRALLAKMGQQ